MNPRILSIALALMLLATTASAQTRKIGHRSHSGSPAAFAAMLGEDHLGDSRNMNPYPPRLLDPIYRVDPFIVRVRKHYEAIAQKPASIEVQQTQEEATEKPADLQPGARPVKADSTKPALAPKRSTPKRTIPKIAAIPAPDFLVKAPNKAAAPATEKDAKPANSLWMLALVLGISVAPCIFLASALLPNKKPMG
jgi:hypothetical protein